MNNVHVKPENDSTASSPVIAVDRPIPVMEIFGPTVQGEGMVVGRKTMFVRTAGCDYRCSWCDSAFTWDGSAKDTISRMNADEIWQELYRLGGERFDHVTLSGGNPALLSQLGTLVDELHRHGITVAVETQGSRWQDWLNDIDEVTISPSRQAQVWIRTGASSMISSPSCPLGRQADPSASRLSYLTIKTSAMRKRSMSDTRTCRFICRPVIPM